ncbi:MAG: thymidine phosphorylase family protein [Alsobacter sp.]
MTADDIREPLRARRIGIHTQHEAVVFMRTDCHVCRSEGLTPLARVLIESGGRSAIATLYQVSGNWLQENEVGLSESSWERLRTEDGATVSVRHPEPVLSLSEVRSRIYGNRLSKPALRSIIGDIVAGQYSDVDVSAFLTACATLPLDEEETIALTSVMVEVGERIEWDRPIVLDKHCVGGLPGNRTTPIVVSIVAALGLTMPKTSSRAITSPAGTADAMETMAPVDLDVAGIRRVVDREGGCIAWGGAVRLSPADDLLIRVERALDLDSEGQLIASVLSKKIAAGATHLVLDIPVGPTAKVRSPDAARALADRLADVAQEFQIKTAIVLSNGLQPVGRGIGPALEAHDVLAVLKGERSSPTDLRERACSIAGSLLELCNHAAAGTGAKMAEDCLNDGRAWTKFQAICEAQGGMRLPPVARLKHDILATTDGVVNAIDNRKIAKVAKLAGAPEAKAAGVFMHVRLGEVIQRGQPLYTIHAESEGELAYALEYALRNALAVEVTA